MDNLFNPTQGLNTVVDISAGTHKVLENAELKNAQNGSGKVYSVYDSLPKQNTTLQGYVMADMYYPFTRRHVMNIFQFCRF